jgi:hypothetical protein
MLWRTFAGQLRYAHLDWQMTGKLVTCSPLCREVVLGLASERGLARGKGKLDRWAGSHRGKQITTHDDFVGYRKATLLPKTQLEPLIASKVYH